MSNKLAVIYGGPSPEHDISILTGLQAAKILSSKYEGLPNVLLEAQYLGKYIISTDCPTGPKEILMNGKLGDLIKVGDTKKLALKILQFYKNKNKSYVKKKTKLAKQMLKRFDYNFCMKKYESVIKKYLYY